MVPTRQIERKRKKKNLLLHYRTISEIPAENKNIILQEKKSTDGEEERGIVVKVKKFLLVKI